MNASSLYDDDALQAFRTRTRIDPDYLRRWRVAFFKKSQPLQESLESLPSEHRASFAEQFGRHPLRLHSRHDSQRDGASKLLFQTDAGQLLESVILRIRSGRTSLCVSSQVGCAAKCGFCATGQMGVAIHLTKDEILDQVAQANQLLRLENRSIRNVVFMGMGEPFHNEDAVHSALDALLSPRFFNLSPAHVLVSTVGIPEAMVRFAERFPSAGLALSLHSARQEHREELIPLARRYPLDALRRAIVEVTVTQTRPVMVEYLLLAGVNDSDEDLAALVEYLEGLRVHINLIPYNSVPGIELTGTTSEARLRFGQVLSAAGFKVTTRRSLGSDIAAACGQLAKSKHSG